MTKIKPIAIVLPQFHPIKENDEWWGEGFTEWSNVVKGKPRFKGHYQPHLPRHLGYYDMRLEETRIAQAELAKKYGIYGFCYYHYWFNGRRILERPVDDMLASGKPEFPFMLCWANENWSRNWDGGFNKILLEQHYTEDDFIIHAQHLVKYFKDDRYIKIEGRPVFSIYRDQIIPDLEKCLLAFRSELKKFDIDVFLVRFESFFGSEDGFNSTSRFFDASIEMQPHSRQFYKRFFSKPNTLTNKIIRKFKSLLNKLNPQKEKDIIIDYKELVINDLKSNFQKNRLLFPGVCPSWDNTSRRKNGAFILKGSSPALFQHWVENKIKLTNWDLLSEKFLFINAWNEWAEGNHLEPCERYGLEYLEAFNKAICIIKNK